MDSCRHPPPTPSPSVIQRVCSMQKLQITRSFSAGPLSLPPSRSPSRPFLPVGNSHRFPGIFLECPSAGTQARSRSPSGCTRRHKGSLLVHWPPQGPFCLLLLWQAYWALLLVTPLAGLWSPSAGYSSGRLMGPFCWYRTLASSGALLMVPVPLLKLRGPSAGTMASSEAQLNIADAVFIYPVLRMRIRDPPGSGIRDGKKIQIQGPR
jgi:hypothetical protein